MSILWIDMHIRDMRVLEWLRATAQDGSLQVAADAIAVEFKCHPNTARAILTRLIRAGQIEVAANCYRGGKFYRIVNA